ncbi:carbohydrate ABC transporter permease [Candidatus Nomurabacteria bacterium]|nr:carbohydrate ABC transporter permease [Candidatus Nomurabacteria bacterium]
MRGSKKISRSRYGNAIIFSILGIFGAFMALPIVYAIIQSFKPLDEIFIFPPRFFVRRPTIDNFTMLFQLTSNLWVPFTRYIFNSLFVTVTGTIFHVLFASMAAFPLAKYKFPGSKAMFNIVVMALLFTPQVTYIPLYVVLARMNMINTYGSLILPSLAGSLGLFLMKQNILMIPDSFIEAAKIDGASEYKVYRKVIMPMVKPAWLTLTIFTFQALWNNGGVTFVYNESLKVLPTVMSQIASGGIARAGVGAAASVFLMIPPILVFLLTQGNIIETMSHSGIKE